MLLVDKWRVLITGKGCRPKFHQVVDIGGRQLSTSIEKISKFKWYLTLKRRKIVRSTVLPRFQKGSFK
jgi:hypothetical protein